MSRTTPLMSTVALTAVTMLTTLAANAGDEALYKKKATALDTVVASFEAKMSADAASGKALQIPRFDRSDFSVMLWVKFERDGMPFIKTSATDIEKPGRYKLWTRVMKKDGHYGIWFEREQCGNMRIRKPIKSGQWNHLTVTQAGREWTVYVNGEKAGQRNISRNRRNGEDVPNNILQIGAGGFAGLVDEFCIYNRALSADEVKAHAGGAVVAKGNGLVAYIPFDGNAKDAAGGNDAIETADCQYVPGKVGKAVKLGKTSRVVLPALDDSKFLAGLRARVLKDFPAERLALEWEVEDAIWDARWMPGDVSALAKRYADASHRDVDIQGQLMGKTKVDDIAGLAGVRALYLKSRRSHMVKEILKTRDPDQALAVSKALTAAPTAAPLTTIMKLKAEAADWVENGVAPARVPTWRAEFDAATRVLAAGDTKLFDFDKILFVKRFKYQSNHYYTDFINSRWMPGGNLCIMDLKSGKVTELVKELKGGIFGRYDLSFDAKRIVFCWKKGAQEGYRIYEINIDPSTGLRAGGTGVKQLTFPEPNESELSARYRAHPLYHHGTDDMDPCYLPDGGICFISTRCQYGILCDSPDNFTTTVLYRMDSDGKKMEKLTNSSVSEATPAMATDGRILYTRWEYVDKGAVSVKCLWAMRPDGSGSVEIYGNDISLPPTMAHPRSIPGDANRYVFTGTPHYPQNSVGTIIRIDMNKNIRTREPMTYMTPDVDVRGERGWWWESKNPAAQRLFKDPYPLSDKFFLCTMGVGGYAVYRNTTAWGLYLLHESGNAMHLYDDEANIGCFMPMPLRPRTKPPVLSAVIDPKLAAKNQAICMVTDIYHGMEDVKRGSIKYIRINEQIPRPWASRRRWGGDSYDQQHVVVSKDTHLGLKVQHGIVPVEVDGSAHFLVPADANIFFQALDENYMEVQRERTYVNYRPGETRACLGCHEMPSDPPAATTRAPTAFKRVPSISGPQPGEKSGARALHFPTDVQPVLDRHCVKCHSGDKPKADQDLSGTLTRLFSVSYENLIRERRGGKGRRRFDLFPTIGENHPKTGNVSYLPARSLGSHNSVLIAMLMPDMVKLKDPGLAAQAAKLAKAHNKIKLPREDRIRLTTWVDTNGQYYGAYWGRRNIQYKDHPNFRPVPTFKTARSYVSPIPEKQR